MIRSVLSANKAFLLGLSWEELMLSGALEMSAAGEEDVLSETSKQDLSSFLARVNEIGTW